MPSTRASTSASIFLFRSCADALFASEMARSYSLPLNTKPSSATTATAAAALRH